MNFHDRLPENLDVPFFMYAEPEQLDQLFDVAEFKKMFLKNGLPQSNELRVNKKVLAEIISSNINGCVKDYWLEHQIVFDGEFVRFVFHPNKNEFPQPKFRLSDLLWETLQPDTVFWIDKSLLDEAEAELEKCLRMVARVREKREANAVLATQIPQNEGDPNNEAAAGTRA